MKNHLLLLLLLLFTIGLFSQQSCGQDSTELIKDTDFSHQSVIFEKGGPVINYANGLLTDAEITRLKGLVEQACKPQIPAWITGLSGNVPANDCMTDYVNAGLSKLRGNIAYQNENLYIKIGDEFLTSFYYGMFGMLYCMTDEEAVSNHPWGAKFLAGGIHELVFFVDINSLIEGIGMLVKSGAEIELASYKSFLSDIKQTFTDTKNGVSISSEELTRRLTRTRRVTLCNFPNRSLG